MSSLWPEFRSPFFLFSPLDSLLLFLTSGEYERIHISRLVSSGYSYFSAGMAVFHFITSVNIFLSASSINLFGLFLLSLTAAIAHLIRNQLYPSNDPVFENTVSLKSVMFHLLKNLYSYHQCSNLQTLSGSCFRIFLCIPADCH